jgi:hypothetical protein
MVIQKENVLAIEEILVYSEYDFYLMGMNIKKEAVNQPLFFIMS